MTEITGPGFMPPGAEILAGAWINPANGAVGVGLTRTLTDAEYEALIKSLAVAQRDMQTRQNYN